MSSVVTATGPHLDARADFGRNSFSQGGVEQQIQETERTLERLSRELSLARARAVQQTQKLAEARRRMEQWRWANPINDSDPEALRLATVSLAAQTRVVDAAAKSNADVSARIDRLQNRIERQMARYYDLQSRRRVGSDARSHDNPVFSKTETTADGLSSRNVPARPSGSEMADDALEVSRSANAHYAGQVSDRDGV